jgi:hypothetical protein
MGASRAVKNVNNFFDSFFFAAKPEDLLHSPEMSAVWEECMTTGVVQAQIDACEFARLVDTMDAIRIKLN